MRDGALDVEELTQRYGPMVLRRCRQLLHDEDEAMDVCQDVFARLLERRERLQAQYPSSLLYRIATNLCLNRTPGREEASDPLPVPSPAATGSSCASVSCGCSAVPRP